MSSEEFKKDEQEKETIQLPESWWGWINLFRLWFAIDFVFVTSQLLDCHGWFSIMLGLCILQRMPLSGHNLLSNPMCSYRGHH